MPSPLQEAGTALARAAKASRQRPSDPTCQREYGAAVERFAAVRAAVAIGRTVDGRPLSPASRRRILDALADVLTSDQAVLTS